MVTFKPSKIFSNPDSVGYKRALSKKYSNEKMFHDVYQLKDNSPFIPYEQAKIELLDPRAK